VTPPVLTWYKTSGNSGGRNGKSLSWRGEGRGTKLSVHRGGGCGVGVRRNSPVPKYSRLSLAIISLREIYALGWLVRNVDPLGGGRLGVRRLNRFGSSQGFKPDSRGRRVIRDPAKKRRKKGYGLCWGTRGERMQIFQSIGNCGEGQSSNSPFQQGDITPV